MRDTGYVYQLRQLKNRERVAPVDLTDQAMTVYTLREQTILASGNPQPVIDQQIARARSQWAIFMGRPFPVDNEIPF